MHGEGACVHGHTLTLPYPVSVNVMWRNFCGRPILSPKGRAYKALAAQIATDAGMTSLAGDVALQVVLHAKQTKKPTGKLPRCIDLSNFLKVAEDSLIGIAFADDAQTRQISMRYGDPSPTALWSSLSVKFLQRRRRNEKSNNDDASTRGKQRRPKGDLRRRVCSGQGTHEVKIVF